MKVSVLAVLATAMLATASVVPSCDRENTDVDSLDLITIRPPPLICLKVCWPKPHRCPPGQIPKKFGRCWTCCRRRHRPHGVEFEEEEFEGLDEFDELD
jgi:hypothetical protein